MFRVSDLGHALAYYREQPGFEIEFVYAGFHAGVARDSCRIELKNPPPTLPNPAEFAAGERIDACFGARDAGALAADFTKTGVDFTVSLCEMPYGKEFYLRDLDGHVLAFVEGDAQG